MVLGSQAEAPGHSEMGPRRSSSKHETGAPGAAGTAWGGLNLGSSVLPCVCTENVNTEQVRLREREDR